MSSHMTPDMWAAYAAMGVAVPKEHLPKRLEITIPMDVLHGPRADGSGFASLSAPELEAAIIKVAGQDKAAAIAQFLPDAIAQILRSLENQLPNTPEGAPVRFEGRLHYGKPEGNKG